MFARTASRRRPTNAIDETTRAEPPAGSPLHEFHFHAPLRFDPHRFSAIFILDVVRIAEWTFLDAEAFDRVHHLAFRERCESVLQLLHEAAVIGAEYGM